MTEPSAKVILDSVSPAGDRLTTLEVVMHRSVLAEFNTHRVLSRNSESSRAVPVDKRLKRFDQDPAWPVFWAGEGPGMAAGAELTGDDLDDAMTLLGAIMNSTSELIGEYLNTHPEKATRLHKSLLNRPMEWALWHTVICTSTEWDNFFNLRCHPAAQPEMRAAAEAMRAALNHSTPKELEVGHWHMPYIREVDYAYVKDFEDLRKISAGRCARVSYLTHDGTRDPAKDIQLYESLVSNGHASPLEHVATPCPSNILGTAMHFSFDQGPHLGNFKGWDQLRHKVIDF